MLGVEWAGEVNLNAGKQLDSLTSINRLTFLVADLLALTQYFVTSLIQLVNVESTILFFKHAMITLFLQRSMLICPFPQIMVEKFGTIRMPMLKGYKNPYLFLIGEKAFENLSFNQKIGLLNNSLLNIFCNYIPKKIVIVAVGTLRG